ncbi:RNA 3'-terminal phosphate cyclase [Psychrobium sp. MM17-31]|uniref:RNA 3'-terminal phosphate cyclase n=1 Tax=Psychrobium sp. MM17-31 TaxID=2917758 RepID=UPI001EF5B0EE|nr:RNA 3'-terminal phosphate cyclase [Psychrobium sp. MM17-31]MCG7532755.1 RNA 3'-terminal phosphate cyclase [Psychrobium sp. MM17-31]
MITIDGAMGEGGGQVLRTSLTLAMLTGQPLKLINIRAKRNKPGLLRQHLTAVLAAQQITNGQVTGAQLGSQSVEFVPGKITAGDYHFAIGSAGSTVLVCQTILLALAFADKPSTVTFEGGTHNGKSPSLSFLQQSFLPLLEQMGVKTQVRVERYGFYPAGGGKWSITIEPTRVLKPLELTSAGAEFSAQQRRCSLTALMCKLAHKIGVREIAAAKETLAWQDVHGELLHVDSPAPGNSFQVAIAAEHNSIMFEEVGRVGVSAERVANGAAKRARDFIASYAAVEEHLADQLLLPLALAQSGCFTTTKPSLHTTTNIDVIKQFLELNFMITQENESLYHIEVQQT